MPENNTEYEISDNLPTWYKPTETVIALDKTYKQHGHDYAKWQQQDLASIKQDLQTRGWTCIEPKPFAPINIWEMDEDDSYEMNEQKIPPTQKFLQRYSKFFASGKNSQHVLDHFPKNRYGYFTLPKKEGYRYMTQAFAKHFSLPVQLNTYKFANSIEVMAYKIWTDFGEYLFEPKHNVENIPLLALKPKHDLRFGLFDIVKYHGTNFLSSLLTTPDPITIHPHADPGLFSISVGSTAAGLQMYDPTRNAWVAIPPETWILWCGEAAQQVSDNVIKSGVHRVVHAKEARVTAWYEVCVDSQVPNSVLTNTPPTAEEVKIEKLLSDYEYQRGMSMSKSGIVKRRTVPAAVAGNSLGNLQGTLSEKLASK